MKYGGEVKGEEPFATYIQELRNWANSPYGHPKVKSIYAYLSKGRLIQDLIEDKKLFVDNNHRLIVKWDKKYEALSSERPPIYGVIAGGLESAFIRFTVYSPNNILTKVWEDPEVYESFIQYYQGLLGSEDLCYVTGKLLPSTERHANKIRNAADKAKLISANDTSGFTFRGRFTDSKDAASISYEVSQKAHNALKWLIQRQGKSVDQRVFLVWTNEETSNIPDPMEDSFDIAPGSVTVRKQSNTNVTYAKEFAKAMDGYRYNLSMRTEVNIMVLDSATTGRMAVLYYRNFQKELYLDKIEKWHTTCAWLHRYRKNEDGEFVQFFGAPATKDIAFAAYGPRASEKVVKGLIERLLPCIVDGMKLPRDIVTSVYQRASNPAAMDKWEWEKTLSIACALINKMLMEQGEGFQLGLDINCEDRSYLFGRMLAVADVLERRALGDEKRATNAIRYMNAFANHPERTWKVIHAALQPYQVRLGREAVIWTRIIDEISSKFKLEDFNNQPLSGKYLLGFSSQRHELYQKKDKNQAAETPDKNDEEGVV